MNEQGNEGIYPLEILDCTVILCPFTHSERRKVKKSYFTEQSFIWKKFSESGKFLNVGLEHSVMTFNITRRFRNDVLILFKNTQKKFQFSSMKNDEELGFECDLSCLF